MDSVTAAKLSVTTPLCRCNSDIMMHLVQLQEKTNKNKNIVPWWAIWHYLWRETFQKIVCLLESDGEKLLSKTELVTSCQGRYTALDLMKVQTVWYNNTIINITTKVLFCRYLEVTELLFELHVWAAFEKDGRCFGLGNPRSCPWRKEPNSAQRHNMTGSHLTNRWIWQKTGGQAHS